MSNANATDTPTHDKPTEVFLFPLTRVVFFPSTTKPLNIFEPRYIEMVNEALENDTPVALVNAEPSASATLPGTSPRSGGLSHLKRIGGVGRLRLLERRDDGTMLILLEGQGKVHIRSLLATERPFLQANVTWIEEDNRLAPENVFILNRIVKELARWLNENVPDRKQRDFFFRQLETPEEKLNYFCSLAVDDADWQQRLLETANLNDRLKLASLLLESYSVVL